jgi:hypothetical protein
VGAGSFHHGLAFLTESLAEMNEVLKWGQGKAREGKEAKSFHFLLSFVEAFVVCKVACYLVCLLD